MYGSKVLTIIKYYRNGLLHMVAKCKKFLKNFTELHYYVFQRSMKIKKYNRNTLLLMVAKYNQSTNTT